MAASIEYMVRQFLVRNNYEGLCNPGSCGCDLKDLMAYCEPSATMCRAAYRFDCARCLDGPEHNADCKLCDGDGYMMSTDIDYCHPMYVGGGE